MTWGDRRAGANSVSPSSTENPSSRTGPRGLLFSSGNQHCWNGDHHWFTLLSATSGGICLAPSFLICTSPYLFFSFLPLKEFLINLSYWWVWKSAACSLSQDWNAQVLHSALPFLVLSCPAPAVGELLALKGLGSYFMVLVWTPLLRWVVAARWSNGTSASAFWPWTVLRQVLQVCMGKTWTPCLVIVTLLCITFGSW